MRRYMMLIASAAAVMAATPVCAAAMSVPIDQARVLSFGKAVSTVYVGNPSMADVQVIDPHRVFVLGKAFGTTNLIALDRNGKIVSQQPLKVEGHRTNTVTLNRGVEQYTFACAGSRCEAAPVPGDANGFYQPVMGENSQRQTMGASQAMASNAPPQQ